LGLAFLARRMMFSVIRPNAIEEEQHITPGHNCRG